MSRLTPTTTARLAAGAVSLLVITAAALPPAAGVEDLQVRQPDRPHSADAAERWWASCAADLPLGADAAERWAAECW